MTLSGPSTEPAVTAGVRASYLAFSSTGFAFASWASRIPQVRDRLHLDSTQLGLLLLAVAAGSLVAIPASGIVVGRFGSRRTIGTLAVVNGLSLAGVAVGYQFGVVPVLIGLIGFGVAQGGWDVAMNVQGAAAERRLGTAIMSRFHAGFSLGTVAGAVVGAAMVALEVPVTAHLGVVAVAVAVVVPVGVRGFVPDTGAGAGAAPSTADAGRRALVAWREPRTVLIGVLVLAFGFAEGTGYDWTSVAFIDGYHTAPAVGTLGFAAFLAAMTLGRWYGPRLLDRHGRVRVVRCFASVSVAGVILFVLGGATAVGFLGVVLWGGGVSIGFPVGMSAAADEAEMAAPRVGVIASIGYCAFLSGPPLIGFLGHHFGVLRAITAVAVLVAVVIPLAVTVRAPASGPQR